MTYIRYNSTDINAARQIIESSHGNKPQVPKNNPYRVAECHPLAHISDRNRDISKCSKYDCLEAYGNREKQEKYAKTGFYSIEDMALVLHIVLKSKQGEEGLKKLNNTLDLVEITVDRTTLLNELHKFNASLTLPKFAKVWKDNRIDDVEIESITIDLYNKDKENKQEPPYIFSISLF